LTSGLSNNIRSGDLIVIYIDRRRKWIVKVGEREAVDSDKGLIRLNNIENLRYGEAIRTSLNIEARILRPLIIDYIEKGLERITQIIYPKDIGMIIFLLGISSGSNVLEIGVGSGATTIVLAHIVKPFGHVFGYDIREDSLEIAMRNLRRIGLDRYVTLKLGDARQGVDEKDLDAAIVDIPDPWNVLDTLYSALKPSAPVVFFLPTVNQLEKLYNALYSHKGFIDIRCFETMLREYQLSLEAIRPSTYMVGHTGFIMFARKILK